MRSIRSEGVFLHRPLFPRLHRGISTARERAPPRSGSADRYGQGERLTGEELPKFVPEGVEGLVSYRGPLAEYVFQLVGGLRAAMGYCGCATIEQFRLDAQFCRITGASMVESHPHDIRITKESPNYTAELVARV